MSYSEKKKHDEEVAKQKKEKRAKKDKQNQEDRAAFKKAKNAKFNVFIADGLLNPFEKDKAMVTKLGWVYEKLKLDKENQGRRISTVTSLLESFMKEDDVEAEKEKIRQYEKWLKDDVDVQQDLPIIPKDNEPPAEAKSANPDDEKNTNTA